MRDGKDRIRDELVEELTCSICLELLNAPRSLACGHSMCLECLRALHASQHGGNGSAHTGGGLLKCPVCRGGTVLPPPAPAHQTQQDGAGFSWVSWVRQGLHPSSSEPRGPSADAHHRAVSVLPSDHRAVRLLRLVDAAGEQPGGPEQPAPPTTPQYPVYRGVHPPSIPALVEEAHASPLAPPTTPQYPVYRGVHPPSIPAPVEETHASPLARVGPELEAFALLEGEYVIPFRVSARQVVDTFQEWRRSLWLAPRAFGVEAQHVPLVEVTMTYIPYYVVDADYTS